MTDHGDRADPSPARTTGASDTPEPLRRSVEVEYWVVDERGRLTEPGELLDAGPGVEREFVAPLIEIKTTPCETTDELRAELYERVDRVLERAERHRKRLVPLATPLHRGEIEDLPAERTRIQDRVVGDGFEYVRHCAGTHVHVEQLPDRAIEQVNALIGLDPALALVNSSPYFQGSYLAAGARSKLYRWLAYQTLPRQGELWPYASDVEEWARRVERRYQEFVTEAVIAGFDRERVESCFDPENAVWTPVQLRGEFPTVEWRSPDTALPSQVVELADDVAEFLEHLRDAELRVEGRRGGRTEDEIVLPTFDALTEYVASAVRDGLASEAVRGYLRRMGFDVSAYDPLTETVRAGDEVTEAEAREIRTEYASRLEQDVRRSRSLLAD